MLRYRNPCQALSRGTAKLARFASGSFDVSTMARILDAHNHETRDGLKKLFADPLFTPRYTMTLPEERELAYQRLNKICKSQLFSVRDFASNPANIFAVHEVTGMMDGSTATKLTVQFNLFGGTVFKLGTERHREALCDGIDSFKKVGCFGLTELGYGNNAVEMETTATYDPASEEFVINTPSPLAQKYWITNGAVHAHYCVVFASLILPDGTNEGLHGFVVPIRDEATLAVKDGVEIWDMGHKIGINGIDNGALWFHNVRIPRGNLLDSTSQVAADGSFSSTVEASGKRKRKRFLVLADQLLSGRVCIASMCQGSTKCTLLSTVRYALSRKAVGRAGDSDMSIMQYQLQQKAIMPLVAQTYALNFGLAYIQQRYGQLTRREGSGPTAAEADAKAYEELVRLCCIVKPLVTWNAENTATTCRERCGGQGFLSSNRFGEAIVGAHAGITAEGDNRVICQKVSKELLSSVKPADVKNHVIAQKLPLMLRFIFGGGPISGRVTTASFFTHVFKAREVFCKNELAFRLHISKKAGTDLFDAWMMEESDLIQRLALAYGERVVLEEFSKRIDQLRESSDASERGLVPALEDLRALYALSRIMSDVGPLISDGLLHPSILKPMDAAISTLCVKLADCASDLVEGFGIPEHMIHAPIAKNWVQYNSTENNGELTEGNRAVFRK